MSGGKAQSKWELHEFVHNSLPCGAGDHARVLMCVRLLLRTKLRSQVQKIHCHLVIIYLLFFTVLEWNPGPYERWASALPLHHDPMPWRMVSEAQKSPYKERSCCCLPFSCSMDSTFTSFLEEKCVRRVGALHASVIHEIQYPQCIWTSKKPHQVRSQLTSSSAMPQKGSGHCPAIAPHL